MEQKVTRSLLHEALVLRFGEGAISRVEQEEMCFLLVKLELKKSVTVLLTDELSNHKMPIPNDVTTAEFIELYFCLPNYWGLDDYENPQMNWVFFWAKRLINYVQENNTWFAHGHTMPCGKEKKSLSPTMKQNHFLLSYPILLEKELRPLVIGDKTVQFLSIIPIFEKEMNYKQHKGMERFMQKMLNGGITEKLDDFRGSALKSKWRF
jgi:hypothetical protein